MSGAIVKTEEVRKQLGETYAKGRSRWLSYIRSRVSDPETAEDILQDVFRRAVESASVLDSVENLVAWIGRSIQNRIIDWYRSKQRVKYQSTLTSPGDSEGENLEDLILDLTSDPADLLERSFLIETLTEAIMSLPEEQRAVLELHDAQGLTFSEISKQIGVPINTLLSRKRYAVLTLRRRLSWLAPAG